MKVGIVHFMAYPFAQGGQEPVADAIAEIVEDDFFDAIEVTRIDDDAERRRVADLLNNTSRNCHSGKELEVGPGNAGNVEVANSASGNIGQGMDKIGKIQFYIKSHDPVHLLYSRGE